MEEKETIAEIRDLYINFYTYDGIVKALDGVKLYIKKGEVLGLVGETGCGKSVTSLSMLAMVISPGSIEKGSIKFNTEEKELDLLHLKTSELLKIRGRYISMIFQEPRAALNPVYTVGDQIAEVFYHHRMEEITKKAIHNVEESLKTARGTKRWLYKRHLSLLNKMLRNPKALTVRMASKIPLLRGFKKRIQQVVRKETVELLRILRIPDPERVVDMYPHELSGGMAQRVVIAMALTCNPTLLIADEPTTNLDVTVQMQILHLIKELRDKFGSSILYVTHDLGVVAELCERVAVMYAGNVVEVADVMTFFKKPLHPYAQALLQSIPRPGHPFVSIPGTVPSLINPPPGCRFHERCAYAMEICRKVKPNLVEVEKGHEVACHLYTKVEE
ncbi:MAG: ABC transporter ATP-binding protein [Candidatus Bathyarchaeia archaeon]